MGDSKSELQSSRKPVAVLISDIHFNLQTLSVATAALQQAVSKANDLGVPLIIAGDLHDTKANIRGECINAIRKTLRELNGTPYYEDEPNCYILRGNHDSINEKSIEHSLGFLHDLAYVIDAPRFINEIVVNGNSLYLIPYHHDVEELRAYLKKVDPCSVLIMHQGIEGSHSGDYYQDKSALHKDDVHHFRVISGHYHRRQDIKIGRPRKGAVGLWSYIGNPFTLGFGEAEDPSKGFQVLYSDGLMEHVPTNLRKHVVYEISLAEPATAQARHFAGDLIWVKLSGTREELSKITRTWVGDLMAIDGPFRLDLIPSDIKTSAVSNDTNVKQPELLDAMIDSTTNVSDAQKARLKNLWKELK